MKTLLVLRHAHAAAAPQGMEDHDRPLADSGIEAASRVGLLLYQEGLTPDHIVTSTAVRAVSTAAAVSRACHFDGRLQPLRRLYLASCHTHVQALRTVPDESRRVLVVGHNPGVEEILGALTGAARTMLPAALARILVPVATWDELEEDVLGKLVRLWQPGDIP